MKQPKRILVLSLPKNRMLLYGLIDFRNKLIQQGKHTDDVDELMMKLQKVKRSSHRYQQ